MPDTIDESFNQEFCEKLEYILCSVFSKSEDEDLKKNWCDGIFWKPFYSDKVNRDYLSFKEVKLRKKITTTAKLGVSGQEYYKMDITLGKKSIKAYSQGLSLIDYIPLSVNSTWIEIDTDDQRIRIELL